MQATNLYSNAGNVSTTVRLPAGATASADAPLLALPAFVPASPTLLSSSSSFDGDDDGDAFSAFSSPTPSAEDLSTPAPAYSRYGPALPPNSWPGGRRTCYIFRGLNWATALYALAAGSALAVGLSMNKGASCENPLRVWSSIEIGLCAFTLLNVIWKGWRLPQIIVDRNAQSNDVLIAASRLTIGDMFGIYGGVVLNMAWISWLVLGSVWVLGSSDCSVAAPILTQICSVVIYAHLAVVGLLIASLVAAISALPVLYIVKPALFESIVAALDGESPSMPRGASKDLINSTTRVSVYRRPVMAATATPTTLAALCNADDDDDVSSSSSSSASSSSDDIECGQSQRVCGADECEACPICLSDYEPGEALRELRCGHVFHATCAESWLVTNKTCAACRRPIDGNDEAQA